MPSFSLLKKCAVYLLVTLTVLPFSAPLTSCPLSTFLDGVISSAPTPALPTPVIAVHRVALIPGAPTALVTSDESDAAVPAERRGFFALGSDEGGSQTRGSAPHRRGARFLVALRI